MKEVIRCLGDLVVSGDMDLSYFIKWLVESFDHMVIIDKQGGRHQIHSGLYSGWRGTTWINTVLNDAYVFVARESFRNLYGYDPIVMKDGTGDDLDLDMMAFT